MIPRVTVRPESADDYAAIRRLTEEAFKRRLESDLIEGLRVDPAFAPELSLVAMTDEQVSGHALLTRVTVEGPNEDVGILALGPISVTPERQREGVGSALMWEAIRRAKDLGFRGIILIGHPTYYPRFGFRPGREFGLTCEFEVPDEVFLALPLIEEGLQGVSGRILFPSAFRGIES